MGVIATYENFVEAKQRGFNSLLEDLKQDYPNYFDACEKRFQEEEKSKYRSIAEVPKRVKFMNGEIETINDYDSYRKMEYLRVLELKQRSPEMYQEFRQRMLMERNKPYWR